MDSSCHQDSPTQTNFAFMGSIGPMKKGSVDVDLNLHKHHQFAFQFTPHRI